MSKKTFKRHVDLLLIEKRQKTLCPYQNFSTFMYDHTLHRGKKHLCCYFLQAFSTEEKLKCYMNDCFTVNGKQTIKRYLKM